MFGGSCRTVSNCPSNCPEHEPGSERGSHGPTETDFHTTATPRVQRWQCRTAETLIGNHSNRAPTYHHGCYAERVLGRLLLLDGCSVSCPATRVKQHWLLSKQLRVIRRKRSSIPAAELSQTQAHRTPPPTRHHQKAPGLRGQVKGIRTEA